MFQFSIYSDASISLSGTVKTSWVIKIGDNIVSKGSETAPHKLPTGHSTAAELYGVFIAVNKLKTFLSERSKYKFLLRFTFYSDSQSAVIGFTNPKTRCKDYKQVFEAIEHAVSSLPGEVNFSWLKRGKNYQADKLAAQEKVSNKEALSSSQYIRNSTPLTRTKTISGISAIKANNAYRDRMKSRSTCHFRN